MVISGFGVEIWHGSAASVAVVGTDDGGREGANSKAAAAAAPALAMSNVGRAVGTKSEMCSPLSASS
jgi:hypothetical protein